MIKKAAYVGIAVALVVIVSISLTASKTPESEKKIEKTKEELNTATLNMIDVCTKPDEPPYNNDKICIDSMNQIKQSCEDSARYVPACDDPRIEEIIIKRTEKIDFRLSYLDKVSRIHTVMEEHNALYDEWEAGAITTKDYTDITSQEMNEISSISETLEALEIPEEWKDSVIYEKKSLQEYWTYLQISVQYSRAKEAGSSESALLSMEDIMISHLNEATNYISQATQSMPP
jgi:hypothetical protein